MTESTDPGSEPGSSEEVSTNVSAHDIGVEKIARLHREDSVAVALKLRSSRPDRCEVRLHDPLPQPVRDTIVEFHPDYDQTNWTITDEAVVFEAELEPEAERTMVYGTLIDQPDHLELFSADPTVEVTPFEDIFEYWSGDGIESAPEPAEPVASTAEDDQVSNPAEDGVNPPPGRSTDHSDKVGEQSVVEALVAEVGRRDLSTIEKRELRQALDLDGASDLERQLEALREEVAGLRSTIDTLEQRTAALDELESEVDALSNTVEQLQAEVRRGAHWRSMVHEAIVYEPDGM